MSVYRILSLGFALAPLLLPLSICSQQACTNGICVDGVVADSTGAVIPGAELKTVMGEVATSDSAGHYTLSCVQGSSTMITARADGFAEGKVRVRGQIGSAVRINIELRLASIHQDVQVNGDVASASDDGAGTTVLNAKPVQQLHDDPEPDRTLPCQGREDVAGY